MPPDSLRGTITRTGRSVGVAGTTLRSERGLLQVRLTSHVWGMALRKDRSRRRGRRKRCDGIVQRVVAEERVDRQRWATRDQLSYEIIYWIEHTYNRRRRQRRLGRLTPSRVRARLRQRGSSMITTQPPSTERAGDPATPASTPFRRRLRKPERRWCRCGQRPCLPDQRR